MIEMLVRVTQNGVIERTYFIVPSQSYKPANIYAFFDEATKQGLENTMDKNTQAFIQGSVKKRST